ncbi:hypothetical protein M408DRAFT_295204 [Serendipita vermifera MAFF 305830]|uniref:Uncharacterized protein n=1 Tax=Serendipita vermifera MAFF 305830 TaxID=933852 RepID=A0A0C2XMM6_SERVB|nr:hypothetical protein M408DRAFT_295204 [Serendipita vermifera MAFF 305830]
MADMRGKLDNTLSSLSVVHLNSRGSFHFHQLLASYPPNNRALQIETSHRLVSVHRPICLLLYLAWGDDSSSTRLLPFVGLSSLVQSLRGARPAAKFASSFRGPALIFALTVWHAWKDYRSQESNRVQMMPLMKIMYRDGVFYFCVMVAVRVWNIWVFATRPIYEMYVGIYIMWALTTTLACRIYLNIVREARRGHTTSSLPSASAQTSRPQVPHFKSGYWQATTLDSSHAQEQHMNVMWKGNTFEMSSVDDVPLKRAQSGHVLDIR